jgi:hypothetical protein
MSQVSLQGFTSAERDERASPFSRNAMLVSRAVVLAWLRGQAWVRAIRILAPLGALLIEGWPALIGALLVQEVD